MVARPAVPLAELLKRYRTRARLSQEELAERTGLSVRAISDLERGINRTPRNSTIRLLVEALGLSEEERAGFEALARGQVASARFAPARQRNLPLQLTPFMGREREVDAVRRMLLEPYVRLLTLMGPGGVGKTRLALQVAESLENCFSDGAFFVDLAPISEAELVPQQIAQVLGIAESSGLSLVGGLEAYLREKRMLLVLDNFEQVVLAGRLVRHLLMESPGLKLLITSRVVLRVSGEHEYLVRPLPVPHHDRRALPEQVVQAESVQLFVSRARSASSGFALTAENAPAVAEICRRLDGLPLAIELAAARVRLLSPQAMLPRLGDRLALLRGGAQDMPVRQQTLRTTLDWSYDLLAEPARRLLAALAVFVGDFTLDAAEAVCGSEGGFEVLEGLSALVDASLLQQVESPSRRGLIAGGNRIRMLQTVREYGLARLAESGESEAVHRRYVEYYLELAEAASQEMEGQRQAEWLHRLEVEHDDLRSALRWCQSRGATETLLRLSAALWVFWAVNGHLSEGRHWLEAALADRRAEPSRAWARALEGAGHLAWKQDDYAEAKMQLEQSLGAYRELGDKHGEASVLQDLGATLLAEGKRSQARAYFKQVLQMHRELADKVGISYALRELGLLALREGDYGRAEALTRESLVLQREAGDQQGVIGTLSRLGMVAMAEGDYERARRLQEESLALARELGARAHIPVSLYRLGLVAWKQGDYERAEALLGDTLALWRELGSWHGMAATVASLAGLALERERYEEVAPLAQEGLEGWVGAGGEEGVVEAIEMLAAVSVRCGQPARAARLFGAVAAWREVLDPTAAIDRPNYEHYITAARSALGEAAFGNAWIEGRGLSVERVIRWVVDEEPDHSRK